METKNKNYLIPASILISAIIITASWIYTAGLKTNAVPQENALQKQEEIANNQEGQVLPPEGVVLPIKWGDLGKKLIETGVIDAQKFESIYANRGGLNTEDKNLIYGAQNGNFRITEKNANLILNLLWAY